MCIGGFCESADLTILNPTFVQQGMAPYPFGGTFIACGYDSVGLQSAPMRFKGPIPADPSLPPVQTHGVFTIELPAATLLPRSNNLSRCQQPVILPAESLTFTLPRTGFQSYSLSQGDISTGNRLTIFVAWCDPNFTAYCSPSPLVRTNRISVSFFREETLSQPGYQTQRIFRYEGPPPSLG